MSFESDREIKARKCDYVLVILSLYDWDTESPGDSLTLELLEAKDDESALRELNKRLDELNSQKRKNWDLFLEAKGNLFKKIVSVEKEKKASDTNN